MLGEVGVELGPDGPDLLVGMNDGFLGGGSVSADSSRQERCQRSGSRRGCESATGELGCHAMFLPGSIERP